MKKKLVMYFDRMKDRHLNKDVGLLPYFIAKKFNLDLEYITADDCGLKRFKNYRITKIKRLPSYRFNIFFYLYLIKNAKNIDCLMTIHFKSRNLLIGMLYKKLNSNGKFYIKLDLSSDDKKYSNKDIRIEESDNFIQRKIKTLKRIYRRRKFYFIKYVDLISSEVIEVYENINQHGLYGNKISDRLTLLFNGMDNERNNIKLNKYSQKEDIILTVGRLGIHSKNTEFFLDVIKELDLKNWKVILVGPITDEFKKKIELFYKENPSLKERVIFTGNISDRDKLLNYYNKSKVFCLTSRTEGFALVLPEARYYGNYIVTTDVGGAKEVTEEGEYGRVIPQGNKTEFVEVLQEIINDEMDLEKKYNKIVSRRYEITWENLIEINQELSMFLGDNKNWN
ncbi:hypothetical protein U472_14690 [Orenia metallireducens]|uniref:Glycosyl transferase family 1 domain-containing protein n=1 Tax=Orenia metallireducens TaxID=1413210 RepID=A0A1C0A652_9FIRM|nr:glycosyltransferase family 4 protein [Orenia metallireducens]OCL25576.1 hypothetical protein U472_14690 [Orenia metallireducens]